MTPEPPKDIPYPEPLGTKHGGFSEGGLVEAAAIELFDRLDWETRNLYFETFGLTGTEGRESRREVLLPKRLRTALSRLNPSLPPEAIDLAIEELSQDRSAMISTAANREVYALIKGGVKVKVRDQAGELQDDVVHLIDWRNPENNDFLLGSQVWFVGDMYTRRADLVGFVNGIPLVLFELKGTHKSLMDAYDGNINDYRSTIPHLFIPNAFVIVSNGIEARMGATFATWGFFAEWKKINDEGEEGVVSLETIIRGTCEKARLLDILENFIVYEETKDGLVKKVAKNHQVLGVNRAMRAVQSLNENQGRLGVFWHTQGAGKSLSMVYFAQKVLRTLRGNWTFLVVTDRAELDDQIAGTFVATGAVARELHQVQAQSREHLKQLLTGDERYIFTLIHKFGTAQGETYPKLSDRSDIIVITDEAHRSQYDVLAMNMRRALPNAAFIGFTGTPLMAGEEKTREVFGDYVSIYNFAQSIADGATVPLYYENRIPELQLTNEDLGDDLMEIVEAAGLDEEQERKLAHTFARQYHLITRDDRLEKIAEDVVRHFVGRGHRGKAMFIAIDKATAVRMYDKFREHWSTILRAEEKRLAMAAPDDRPALEANFRWLKDTDMAVVVSQSQNEIAEMAVKGLDIVPHRKRMVTEKLDEKFKKNDDPLRIVFVCAMWITGFDVPSCSTMYIDKPMKNHSLMQTIARANRVAPGKTAGLIVDYVGIFRNLQRAFAIYAIPAAEGDAPIKDKTALVEALRVALRSATNFCETNGTNPATIVDASGFNRMRAIEEAVERLIAPEETRRRFLGMASEVWRLYKAILPDTAAGSLTGLALAIHVVAERIRSLQPKPDISAVMGDVEALLDASLAGIMIDVPVRHASDTEGLVDLSRIDFEKLAERFGIGKKRTEAEMLRVQVEEKIKQMVRQNRSRIDFLERFQKLLDEYNDGSASVETFFEEMLKLLRDLSLEEKRAVREQLTEDELAFFDILTKPDPVLTREERAQVREVAKSLLEKLQREKLVLDWRKRQQTRATVRQTIEEELDRLPTVYERPIWSRKVDLTYQFVFERYPGPSDGLSEGQAQYHG